MKFFKKSYTYAACFGLLLTSSFSYSMLKTFVLSDAIQTVKATTTDTKAAKKAAASATTTDTSYSDDNIQVSLTEKTIENTQVYIADITVSSADYLKTAFAQNTYGTNVTAKTSVTAAENNAILAVNGDYYGANSTGYVIRNGVVYRDTVREDSSNGDLAIYKDGSFKIIYEDEINWSKMGSSISLPSDLPWLKMVRLRSIRTQKLDNPWRQIHGQRLGSSMKTTTLSSCQTDGLQRVKACLSTN